MVKRFGTDGIRGAANTELTPELALFLGRAAARHLGGGSFLIGRDTRSSGPMLLGALSAGLASEGVSVIDVGVIPTPGLAWLAADRGLPAAMISASHNPFGDNGIKLLSPGGSKLNTALESAVEGELEALLAGVAAARSVPEGRGVGDVTSDPGAIGDYEHYLVHAISTTRTRPLSVICDCANGAASNLAPQVFARLGIDATFIGDRPDGININDGCGATAPASLVRAVTEARADIGLSFDGDADRLIAVDDKGNIVDGDYLIALFAFDLDARDQLDKRTVVVTVMSNLGLRRALDRRGIDVIETAVGDRSVTDALDANDLVLGGEQSGHIVFPREATTGDGILTALKLLDLVERSGQSLSALAQGAMTRLPQVLRNVPVPAPSRLDAAAGVWEEVDAVERELGEWGRVLIRASGTEPTVRVMVEAEAKDQADAAVERLVVAVERALGG